MERYAFGLHGNTKCKSENRERREYGLAELAIAVCFAIALMLTPLAMRISWRIGAVDIPRDWRRMHTISIPRGGGLAILAAFTMSVLLFCNRSQTVFVGLCGGLTVFCIGLADDVCPLPPLVKLSVQALAAVVGALGFGAIGPIRFACSILWLILLTNAHNLIDGLDGLFGGTAVMEGLGLALILSFGDHRSEAICSVLLSAACLGFLRYNLPPAQIFAGDCGSGAVGFLLGYLSLPALFSPTWKMGVLAPIFVFAYPLTDLSAAVLRRVMRGQSPFQADRAHLHHRICAMGVSQKNCTAVLCGIAAMLTVCGVTLSRPALSWLATPTLSLSALGIVLFRHLLQRLAMH